MEFGRVPGTPNHGSSLAMRSQRTPGSRQRNRSGSQAGSPCGLSRLNQSPCMTPSRRDIPASGFVSQLASMASPHSVCATPTVRSVAASSDRSPISMRVRTLFAGLPINKKYTLCEQIGEGTFSTVYLAENAKTKAQLALKHLVPTSKPARILMEAKCMKRAEGHHNVVRLVGVWRIGGDVILAMPYTNHCKFIDLVAKVELEEVKLYIANLLSALEHIHKLGIIHRDIKPSNFLYDRQKKKFSLVDFGLAQDAEELQLQVGGRGNKRKLSPSSDVVTKKARAPLTETSSNVQSRSPRARILREHKSPGLRRSPRKMINLGEVAMGELKQGIVASPNSSSIATIADLPKRLNFGGVTPKKNPSNPNTPVRCSPRKITLTNKGGISTLKIANNSIISPDISTPSPSLTRSPSFSLLDPSGGQQSQPTDIVGRTPMLRASMTSLCSSMIPRNDVSISPSSPVGVSCTCPGQLFVCRTCLSLPHLHAARAGTPGFRPPEVLLKCKSQTVAVDMWAAGVILLSILSRSYPFFRSPDDMTALAELISLFGTDAMKNVAKRYNRRIVASHLKEGCDLGQVCKDLGERAAPGESPPPCLVTQEAVDLLLRLLDIDHQERVTATVALSHSFLKGVPH